MLDGYTDSSKYPLPTLRPFRIAAASRMFCRVPPAQPAMTPCPAVFPASSATGTAFDGWNGIAAMGTSFDRSISTMPSYSAPSSGSMRL